MLQSLNKVSGRPYPDQPIFSEERKRAEIFTRIALAAGCLFESGVWPVGGMRGAEQIIGPEAKNLFLYRQEERGLRTFTVHECPSKRCSSPRQVFDRVGTGAGLCSDGIKQQNTDSSIARIIRVFFNKGFGCGQALLPLIFCRA
jgi:hypothetical protein